MLFQVLVKDACNFAARSKRDLQLLQSCKSEANLIAPGVTVLLPSSGMTEVQNQCESRHRPIPYFSNPQKWIVIIQLQLNSPVMKYIHKYKANKFYRLEKLKAEVLKCKCFVQTETCPELQKIMSSSLLNKNIYIKIHRQKIPKSKSFPNVLVTI